MSTKIHLTLLKEKRLELDITQDMLAEMAGITPRTVQRIEAGHSTSLSTAKDLASALELPNYECLTDQKKDKKRAFEDKLNQFDKQCSNFTYENKSVILITIMSLFSFLLSMDLNPDLSVMVSLAFTFTPLFCLVVSTIEKDKVDENNVPPSLFTYFFISVLFLLFYISSTLTATLSITESLGLSETREFYELTFSMPGVDSFSSLQTQYTVVIWVTSLIVANLSAFGIYRLVKKSRNKGVHFGAFPSLLSTVFIMLFLPSLFVGNVKFSDELWYYILPLLAISLVSLYFIIKAISPIFKTTNNEIKKIESRNLKAAIFIFLMPLISLFFALLLQGKVSHYLLLDLDPEYRAEHCLAEPSYDLCWSVNLLKEHNIPTTPNNIRLLDSLNGQANIPNSLFSNIDVTTENLKGETPLPSVFFDFISEYYVAVLTHSPDPHAQIKRWSKDDLTNVLIDPKKNLKWALMAKNNLPMFLDSFEKARSEVKNDGYLLAIFNSHKGIWKVNSSKDYIRYEAGLLSFYTDLDGEVMHFDGEIVSFDTLKKIYDLPRDKFPKNKLDK